MRRAAAKVAGVLRGLGANGLVTSVATWRAVASGLRGVAWGGTAGPTAG